MIYEANYEIILSSKLDNIIKVIGVGGAGCNAMFNMYNQDKKGVDFIACNTDAQALAEFPDEIIKLQIGAKLTKGLGAGTHWEVGRDAAIESEEAIIQVLGPPTEMVFITAGMGGGTGTGAAPEIARVSKKLGRLTIGVVTDPFEHEGTDKLEQALQGIENLKEYCDTVLIIKNDRLAEIYENLPIRRAYKMADEVLARAVKSIAELITRPGVINIDFADVKTILGDAGHAVMGTAEASGQDRAFLAIEEALNSPLLENNDISGAKRVLVSMAYSDEKEEYEITMADQKKIMNFVETKIKFRAKTFKHGFAIDQSLKDKIRVTIVAAQFEKLESAKVPIPPAAPKEEPVGVGQGLNAIIPEKTKKVPKYDPSQTHLFESDNRQEKLFEDYMQGQPNYDLIRSNPTYLRLQVKLFDKAEIDLRNPERVTLQKFYDNLVNQGIIN
jgi:cell division protein FtsZ